MLELDKTIYLSLLLQSVLSVRLSNNLWGSDVLLFFEFINIVSIFALHGYLIYYTAIHVCRDFVSSMQRIYDLSVFI